MSGKGDAHSDTEPQDEKKRKIISLFVTQVGLGNDKKWIQAQRKC
jgi:hypothetical protein